MPLEESSSLLSKGFYLRRKDFDFFSSTSIPNPLKSKELFYNEKLVFDHKYMYSDSTL